MPVDLTALTNDQLRDLARGAILEIEHRRPTCRLAKLLHRAGAAVEAQAFEDGQLETLSAGGDKP